MKHDTLLAVHTYPGANHRMEAHWPFYQKSEADVIGICTEGGKCKWPGDRGSVEIGHDSYIDGHVLPKRLLDTMRFMLMLPYERFCIIEWDCLFFQPIPVFSGMAAFHAGNHLPGMRAERFYHVPWAFDFDTGRKFLAAGDAMLKDVSGHECSPDVFLGWVCQESGIAVEQPWIGYSRNTIESPEDADAARLARIAGAMAIHGIKSERVLKHILS